MKRKAVLQRWIGWFLLACIGVGVVLHIAPYFYHRPLWTDEAMLASSICTRSPSELPGMPLDFYQSAPIGYLYIVKLITMLFGTSKTALRLWSLISGLGSILAVYLLMRNRVGENSARLFTALYALTDRYIYYSNELKPYMSDNLCCLLVLLVWQRYRGKKLSLRKVALIYAALIWFSFAAVFFIAACMLIESLPDLKRWIQRRQREDFSKLVSCALVLVSFALNYVFWLSRTVANAGESGYWDLLKFPLIPRSVADLKLMREMARQFFAFYSRDVLMLLLFLAVAFVVLTVRRRRDSSDILLPFLLSVGLLCIASYLGFYPIIDRMVQMYAIVVLVIAAYACDALIKPYAVSGGAGAPFGRGLLYFFCYALALMLIFAGKGGMANLSPSHLYQMEFDDALEWLNANRTDADAVYVQFALVPTYLYEDGYEIGFQELVSASKNDSGTLTWGEAPCVRGNLICGQKLVDYFYEVPYSYDGEINGGAIEEDVRCIEQFESAYLVFSSVDESVEELLEKLEQHGTVECAYDTGKAGDAKMYHFVRDERNDSL